MRKSRSAVNARAKELRCGVACVLAACSGHEAGAAAPGVESSALQEGCDGAVLVRGVAASVPIPLLIGAPASLSVQTRRRVHIACMYYWDGMRGRRGTHSVPIYRAGVDRSVTVSFYDNGPI